MKKVLFISAFFSVSAFVFAQSKDEKQIIDRTYLLSHTVFGTKDSATLNDLFAKKLTYGHSHGKLQNRHEALSGAYHNQSSYTDTAVSNIQVMIEDDAAIVRHWFKAKEIKKDGTVVPLDFLMMLVWVKEKGKWRLMGRQAVALNEK